MPYELSHRLVVGITPSALFDTSETHAVFRQNGLDAYRKHQDDHIADPLPKGVAFPFVKRLLALNDLRPDDPLVEVIVLAKDDAVTGLRIMKSIESYGLGVSRAVFTEGVAPYRYIDSLNICLFLSGSATDASAAAAAGHPAGKVIGHTALDDEGDDAGALRVALDFDGVLADDSAERIYRQSNLARYLNHERENASTPVGDGPMKRFLIALGRIQQAEYARRKDQVDYEPRVRVALVTARQAPAHERAVQTLRSWNVQVNDAFFLGGVEKASVLSVLRPHIYFDDQINHLEPAQGLVAGVLVPYGIANEAPEEIPKDD
ncbi:5'-nucleotidase [Cellulomonas wangsupingiae]|uniref:5'-nucleotidase n=1 Tax=Cellulomonas wangsupingiae TaxID=2968085 RepID=UPI001D0EFBB8|nr:5'-nucleotidase [Cellulomonas wangsupingiae]MCM0638974.1 5'-nucleotidase [Cellulomonas wangsupingiae]